MRLPREVAVLLLSASAHAALLHVGAGYPHASVGAAVAVAADGDVIVIHDALVAEEVTIDGLDLVIRAATATTWDFTPVAQAAVVQVRNGASVTLRGLDFLGDASTYGVDADASTLTVSGCSFDGFRGAVVADGATTTTVRFSEFSNGTATAVLAGGGDLTVEASRFHGNVASGTAAIRATAGGTVVVTNSRFQANQSAAGAVYCEGCTLTDNVFTDNVSTSSGSAVFAADVELVRNRFCRNHADISGAAAVFVTGSNSIRNNAFVENTDKSGAAALLHAYGPGEIVHNTFVENECITGGSISTLTNATVTFTGNVVAHNAPSVFGAVDDFGATTVTSSYNAWYDNGLDAGWPLGPTELVGVDPLLSGAGGPCSWERIRPLAGSPLVDGDPTLLDADGTAADLGATGGPDAP